MLKELQISNFGIIDSMNLQPSNGLNIITGETGAGKSLLLSAIETILGQKTNAGLIRHGAKHSILRATYNIENLTDVQRWLETNKLPSESMILTLHREIHRQGRPRPLINNQAVSLGLYRQLCTQLVEIHGQHEHQNILEPSVHLDYLDRFAGCKDLRQEVSRLYHRYMKLKNQLKAVTMESDEREHRLEFLHYSVNELDEFSPIENEYENLINEKHLIDNSGVLFKDLSQCYSLLQEDENSVMSRIDIIIDHLYEHIEILPGLKDIFKSVQESLYQLENSVEFIRENRDSLHFSPERLEDIQERISGYQRLYKKYAPDTNALLKIHQKYLDEINSIEMSEDEIEILKNEIGQTKEQLFEEAEKLSRIRRSVVSELEDKLSNEMSNLGMQGAHISVSIRREVQNNQNQDQLQFQITESGLDLVEFLLGANKGEGIQPLRKIASGGELSRITLALKTIFFESNKTGLVIFDEIDTGVGGEIAYTIATRLKKLSRQSQLLVVTHLHQIASEADTHYTIQKNVINDRTISTITKLDSESRIREMARMLGGKAETYALQHARELLSGNRVA